MKKKTKRHQALNRQIDRLQPRLDNLQHSSERYSYLRLLTFLGGFVLNGIAFITIGPGWLWLTFLTSAVLFLTIVYIHNRIEAEIGRYTIWLDITKTHLARMELDWSRIPPSPLQPDNALALDLDLIGLLQVGRLGQRDL